MPGQIELRRLHDVERAEAPSERDVLRRRHLDIAEEQNAVPIPGRLDLGHGGVAELASDIDAEDLGAEALV